MRFAPGKIYKLTEIPGGLVITDFDQKVKDPSARPLVVADAEKLLTYLDRYIFERNKGTDWKDAHHAALHTANVTKVIPRIG